MVVHFGGQAAAMLPPAEAQAFWGGPSAGLSSSRMRRMRFPTRLAGEWSEASAT